MRHCSGIPSERNVAKIQTKVGIFKEFLAVINLVLELKKRGGKGRHACLILKNLFVSNILEKLFENSSF